MNRRGIPSTIEAVPAASQPNRILLRLSPEDAGLAKRIIGQQGCYCATDAEFLERLKVESFQSIVWEISNHVAVRAVAVPNEIVAWARRVPLLLHVAPSEAAMREIGDLAVSSSHLQVSICGRHDLEREIVSMLRSPADLTSSPTRVQLG